MTESNELIPETFNKIIKDFISDILTAFPEYKQNLDLGLMDILNNKNDTKNIVKVFKYIKR